MTVNINHRKQQLIQRISKIREEKQLLMLEQYMENLQQKEIELNTIFKPSKKTLTVEKLIEEQNYKGINKEKIDKLIDEMDIQESLEDLLAML